MPDALSFFLRPKFSSARAQSRAAIVVLGRSKPQFESSSQLARKVYLVLANDFLDFHLLNLLLEISAFVARSCKFFVDYRAFPALAMIWLDVVFAMIAAVDDYAATHCDSELLILN